MQPAAPGVKMRSLLFATQTDCVLVGDSDGRVTVYQLKDISVEGSSQVKLWNLVAGCQGAHHKNNASNNIKNHAV